MTRAAGEPTTAELGALAWAAMRHAAQTAPACCADGSPWTTWLFLGGRGAGKTRAGAEWVWDTAMQLGPGGRIALIAPTHHDARAVMLEGPSGLLRLPYRSGARFEPSLRRVRFPGGTIGQVFSAEEPERLRGPQFHAAWGDELCAWARAEEGLAMLRLGLRLAWPSAHASLLARDQKAQPFRPDAGWGAGRPANLLASSCAQAASDRVVSGSAPRMLLTTTPKPRRWLRRLLAEPGLVQTRAGTAANADNLAAGFEAHVRALYGGTRREAQELDGVVLDEVGALFTEEMIRQARGLALPEGQPLDVVVAVDPPAGTLDGRGRDSCGIVAAAAWTGVEGRRVFRVLGDRTVPGLSPDGWARAVIRAAEDFGARRVVAETNQGGAMVEAVLKGAGLSLPVTRVHAILSKSQRAEPVAALYEQGRVGHTPGLRALEEALMGLGEGADAGSGRDGEGGADRADALVWALTALNVSSGGPRVRGL